MKHNIETTRSRWHGRGTSHSPGEGTVRRPGRGRRLAVLGAGAFWTTALAAALFVYALSGPPVPPAVPSPAAAKDGVPVNTDYLEKGGILFDEHCATCHQQNGKGVPGTFPPLAGNPNLANLALIVKTVHGGHHGKITVNGKSFDQTMPAIGAGFTAEEIAEVATYIRNSWGNQFGGVELSEVKKNLDPSQGKATSKAATPPPVDGALLKEGEKLFMLNCATCHQQNGKGVPFTFPPLADNPNLRDPALILNTVHSGHHGKITVDGKTFDQTMPAIGAGFDAEQLAAVATYVRNSWGNHFGGVSKAQAEKVLESGSSGN
jgi:mono/diheme cytochrome c family protein